MEKEDEGEAFGVIWDAVLVLGWLIGWVGWGFYSPVVSWCQSKSNFL